MRINVQATNWRFGFWVSGDWQTPVKQPPPLHNLRFTSSIPFSILNKFLDFGVEAGIWLGVTSRPIRLARSEGPDAKKERIDALSLGGNREENRLWCFVGSPVRGVMGAGWGGLRYVPKLKTRPEVPNLGLDGLGKRGSSGTKCGLISCWMESWLDSSVIRLNLNVHVRILIPSTLPFPSPSRLSFSPYRIIHGPQYNFFCFPRPN